MGEAEHAVVVAGAGPTGMMLAGELTLAGVDVIVVERRSSNDLTGSRSGGLHARTIEVLDQRGIADRFLAEGQAMQVQSFARIPLDISDFPTRHNYGLALWQNHFERILGGWIGELGVPIAREREVTDFAQDDTGVDIGLSKTAGIGFPGWDPSISSLIAEVELSEEPDWDVIGGRPGLIRHDDNGTQALAQLDDGPVRLVASERYSGQTGEPTLRDVSQALVAAWGTDYGVHSPSWISRFTDMTRQAASYRKGRVLLAGDAAHVHYPIGGQGLNIGVQDAVNLGWKLAQVVHGTSLESLLDTYQSERHPVAARVLQNTMAQTALTRADARIGALRESLSELMSMDEPRKRFAGMISGLDVHYDLGEGHALLGRRMPDLDLVTAGGPRRAVTLLHDARPVLLDLGGPGGLDIAPWADRVQPVDATYDGPWELPVVGDVPAPTAVLIRPDGHVAWVGDGTDTGLRGALTTWFGAS